MSNDKSYTLEMEVPRKTVTEIDLADIFRQAGAAALEALAKQLSEKQNKPPMKLTIDIPTVQLSTPGDDVPEPAESEAALEEE